MVGFIVYFFICFHLNIDLGGENTRVAGNTFAGEMRIVPNKKNRIVTPSAAVVRAIEGDISPNNFDNCQFKFGEDAIQVAKRHPESGSQYLGRIIGRDESEDYNIPSSISSINLLGLFLADLFSSPQMSGSDGCTVTIPAYYTLQQREDIIKAVWAAHIPFLGLVDDYTAVIQLYSERFKEKYMSNNHTVLFVDIGATHVSAYRVDFYFNTSIDQYGNQTSFVWSEDVGCHAFARKIAKQKGVSFKKAKLILESNSDYSDLLEDEIGYVKSMIKEALNDPVDEVQIFGGGSKLQFVIDAVKKASGMDVKRDLPPFDTTVLGGAYLAQHLANASDEMRINVNRVPIYTMNVTCANVTGEYCVKGANCTDLIILDDTICDTLIVNADPSEAPEGTKPVLSKYVLKNISKFDREEEEVVSGIISLAIPMPIIIHTSWCITSIISCQPIDFQQYEEPISNFKPYSEIVESFNKVERKRRRILTLKSKIFELSEQIRQFLQNRNDISMEETEQSSINFILEQVENISAKPEVSDLEEILDTINKKARYLGIN